MIEKMTPIVIKGKGEEESHIDGAEMLWFCRDCRISATAKRQSA